MLKFRKAKITDIEQLTPLLHQLFSQEREFIPNENLQKEALTKIINDKNIGEIYICENKDKILAMVNILYTISTALGGEAAILEDMIVDIEHRNQNIGSKLIKYVIKKLEQRKITRITLLTDSDNFNAHNFYENLNFRKSNMIPFRLIIN